MSSDQDAAPGGRGRLADLIATRGGLAAPEAPFVIEHREALIYMLCEAAELEHGIMCQYLFAAFSLKQQASEGLTGPELDAAVRWRTQISHVAAQEMLHLALVQNVLSAIGAAPHLTRSGLPTPAGHYPAGVQLTLLPFGEPALRHFMYLERPEGMALDDAEGIAAVGQAVPAMSERDVVPRGQDFATVGHLYRSIEAGLHHLVELHGEDWLFVGPPQAQATEDMFGWPQLIPVTDLSSACRAIEEILEQGEGPRGEWRDAHFGQFVAILDEYLRLRAARPGFEPARPVLAANVRPHPSDDQVPLITDPLTARVTDLFNVGYEVLLQIFERFFSRTDETNAQLKTLADATVGLMIRVIKPLADVITQLPAGPDYPGRAAGPSFELFYESDYLMPHREAAWALLAERLDVAARLCHELPAGEGQALAGPLAPVESALRDISASLAAHLPAHSPHAQLARPAATLTPADVGQRAARAAALITAAASAPGGTGTDGALAALAGELSALAGQAPAALAERIWAAAKTATALRVRLAGPGGGPAELIEATAALQDLACRLVPPAQAAQRLDELWSLQAGMPATLQAERNGPYLVTNVPRLVDHLGEEHRPAPQLALCRCGNSAAKPLCDGSHSGFTDARDPNRVPDRRDTYPGQQVTIFDNRGICQHSGFCTDRLATVFRTSADPFVAPSGGRMDEIIRAVRDCPSGALSYAIDGVEARDQADWGGTRPPAIEVTKDGPYRLTGSITVLDADGHPAQRAQGASAEHCALCRCGHSQNKPFCSGMHWYIGFRDPQPPAGHEPTPFEWAGGLPALTRMARLLYEKHIPADPHLAAAYANMAADQPQRLARWLGAALGGPGEPADLACVLPPGSGLTEEQRARWLTLAGLAADEAQLPADPYFRPVLLSCLDWTSRLTVREKQASASHEPSARWDWGPAGPPPAQADTTDDQSSPPPGPDEPVGFEAHIKPLFRERDRQSMSFAFDLWSAADVGPRATEILARLRDGSMPCDGAWPEEKIAVFQRWIDSGQQP
jgi:CDGSH-type Zn-finger protein/truncated hemoglobin YjbI